MVLMQNIDKKKDKMSKWKKTFCSLILAPFFRRMSKHSFWPLNAALWSGVWKKIKRKNYESSLIFDIHEVWWPHPGDKSRKYRQKQSYQKNSKSFFLFCLICGILSMMSNKVNELPKAKKQKLQQWDNMKKCVHFQSTSHQYSRKLQSQSLVHFCNWYLLHFARESS